MELHPNWQETKDRGKEAAVCVTGGQSATKCQIGRKGIWDLDYIPHLPARVENLSKNA